MNPYRVCVKIYGMRFTVIDVMTNLKVYHSGTFKNRENLAKSVNRVITTNGWELAAIGYF